MVADPELEVKVNPRVLQSFPNFVNTSNSFQVRLREKANKKTRTSSSTKTSKCQPVGLKLAFYVNHFTVFLLFLLKMRGR